MKNVLLVDDDEIFNFLNKKVLQGMGFAGEIHSAINGKQAIDLLNDYYLGNSTAPDVILLDLDMPVMDGFGFIEAFKKLNIPNKENVSIVIVTSSDNPKDMAKAKALGITHYLTKPLSRESLKEVLGGA